MDRNSLLAVLDPAFLDQLYGFCYRRCPGSAQAEDLCSEIVLAVVEAARQPGEVAVPEAFIWKIAHNVWADRARLQRREAGYSAAGDPEDLLARLPLPEGAGAGPGQALEQEETIQRIFREIAFLSKAYREVMILRYLEGMPIPAVAKALGLPANTVRQRLFYARNAVRNEVAKEMANREDTMNRPLSLQQVDYEMIGTGQPGTGNPWDLCCDRQFSRHVLWLCRNKAATAKEIAQTLNVPMPYVEEELELQCGGGANGYGLLRRLDGGRYINNFILLSQAELREAQAVYTQRIPMICRQTADFVEAHQQEYLDYPYLNKTVTRNLVLWQQIHAIAGSFCGLVGRTLREKYLADVPRAERPFTIYGYRRDGEAGSLFGLDSSQAYGLCGYACVEVYNLYNDEIHPHFRAGHNIAADPALLLAVRAIGGLPVSRLTEEEKEQAAKAIACGYLYREGDTLYTKILVSRREDGESLFAVSRRLEEVLQPEAEDAAAAIAKLVRARVPEHLWGDYPRFNSLANLPVAPKLAEALAKRGLLALPENGIGAEGCWMLVSK